MHCREVQESKTSILFWWYSTEYGWPLPLAGNDLPIRRITRVQCPVGKVRVQSTKFLKLPVPSLVISTKTVVLQHSTQVPAEAYGKTGLLRQFCHASRTKPSNHPPEAELALCDGRKKDCRMEPESWAFQARGWVKCNRGWTGLNIQGLSIGYVNSLAARCPLPLLFETSIRKLHAADIEHHQRFNTRISVDAN